MYPVTDAYNEEMEKSVRNRSWIKIDFGVTDPDAPGASTLSDNGHLSYSNTQGTVIGATSTSYATLEHNRWILDGKNPIPVTDNPIYQGYVGNEISNAQCGFENQPQIVCVLDDYFEFAGLSFYFDMSMEDYPSEFKIEAYYDTTKVYEAIDHPNDAYWIHDKQIPICNKIVLTWIKSVRPYRRARLSSFVFGVGMTLTEGDIESCTVEKEFDLLSTKFPKNNFDFTIFDTEKRYDPENPAGVWEYLESRQGVDVSVGYSLDDGTIEWIPWTHAYTSGEFSVSGSDVVTLVTIKCVGLIEHLTQRYDTSQYYPEGRSLYDLAYDVINDIGFSNVIEVDTALRDIKTRVPLPSGQANEVLQLIANAGRCVMNHTRGGVLQLVRDSASEPTFELDFSKMLEKPSTSKTAPLRDLYTLYHPVSVAKERSDVISNQEVEVVGDKRIYRLTNIITNGGYENGATTVGGYSAENTTNMTKTNDAVTRHNGLRSLKLVTTTKNTTYPGVRYNFASGVLPPNHVMYFKHTTLVTLISGGYWYSEVTNGSTSSRSIESRTTTNEWTNGSCYFTAASSGTISLKPIMFQANAVDVGATAYIDDILLVDLTEAFGEGNEPSKEWCDLHLRYFDGSILMTEDSYIANNIVVNGSFENSLTGWNVVTSSTPYITASDEQFVSGSHSRRTIVDSQLDPHCYFRFDGALVNNHILYFSMYLNVTDYNSSGYVSSSIYRRNASATYINELVPSETARTYGRTNGFERISWRGFVNGSDEYAMYTIELRNNAAFRGTYYGDDYLLLDLTDIFGAGNEPSKEWCDLHLSYFDGTSVLTFDGLDEVVFNHDAAINQIVSVSDGLFMGTPIKYVNKTVVPLFGSGKITISANKLDFADIEYTKRYRDVGEDLTTMQNDLIDNYEDCVAYADWVADIVQRRNYYKVSDRGYPQLDLGDKLTFTSNFLNEIVATVTKQKISFNGAITGEGEYTIGGDE